MQWWTDRTDLGWLWAGIREDARRRGIGTSLATAAEQHLRAAGARKLTTSAHEGSAGQRFAEARGYAHTRTERFSAVDPRAVDLARSAEFEAAKRAEGFRVVPLREVRERPRDWHELDAACIADVPADDPATNFPYDDWRRELYDDPDIHDDASRFVLAGDRLVAYCLLRVNERTGLAEHEMTGTHPDFRRRGLARFAKLASIRWCAENGIREIWTGNDAENRGMFALNQELGYRVRIVRVELAKEDA